MSALSGITVSPDLAAKFAEAIQSQSIRFIKISIRDELLVHDLSVPIVGSFEQDLETLQDEDVFPSDVSAYILAKLDPPTTDWLSISYIPDAAKVRDKMLYASTRLPLFRSLGSSSFVDAIFATSKSDITPLAYASHRQLISAPHPRSVREQEIADLGSMESETASYEGYRARASHVGAGVGLQWSEPVESAIIEFARGTNDSVIIITVDPKAEQLEIASNFDCNVYSLGTSLPQDRPCYAMFTWQHSYGASPSREIIFIYSCPSNSPVKDRMLYSSGSTSTFQAAKKLLAASCPTANVVSRKIEISDPRDLDELFLKSQLGYLDVESDPRGTGVDRQKTFAKPRPPPRRR